MIKIFSRLFVNGVKIPEKLVKKVIERTEWFPYHIVPVHVGWYEVESEFHTMLYFNGFYWYAALDAGLSRLALQVYRWRGLTERCDG